MSKNRVESELKESELRRSKIPELERTIGELQKSLTQTQQ